jgi:hypothetical protein
MPPLASLGIPHLPATADELESWQPWAAAVLGALAALDGPLGETSPEELRAYFHPLVAGAAALLWVLSDEARGQEVAWPACAPTAGGILMRFVDGRAVLVSGLVRVAAPQDDDVAWLTALLALAQITLQAAQRWPELRPLLPAALRYN